MKKLLAPIDFTAASKSSFKYAAYLSELLNASLSVVHIFPEPISEQRYSEKYIDTAIEKEKKKLLAKAEKFCTDIIASCKIDVAVSNYFMEMGNSVEDIIKICKKNGSDLIIIGTRAKHNLAEYMFGSVSSELMRLSDKPVLIIPEGVKYKPIKTIAFASPKFHEKIPVLEDIRYFADAINAKFSPFYISVLPSDFSTLNEDILNAAEVEQQAKSEVQIEMISARSVLSGIDYYIKINSVDILVMCTHSREYFERLFHKSITKKMVFQAGLPLLIFKEKT